MATPCSIVARMSSAERYKGHDELLEAWPIVKAHLPDARLVCVGDGDDLPRLQQKAHELGIGSETIFTGFVSADELHGWYDAASVFAMPSRGEGFGLVYLEAMSHGLPCIGSVHDAAGEIIDDGVTGHLVDQSDPRELGAVAAWPARRTPSAGDGWAPPVCAGSSVSSATRRFRAA